MEKCLRNHYIKFWWEMTPQSWKMAIFPQLSTWWPYCWWCNYWRNPFVQAVMTWKWAKWVEMSKISSLYLHWEVSLESLYQIWRGTDHPRAKNSNFLPLLNWQAILSLMSLEKLLGYDFYIHQYWLCNIDFPTILTQNCCSKRIINPGPKCTFELKATTCNTIVHMMLMDITPFLYLHDALILTDSYIQAKTNGQRVALQAS